MEKKVYYRFENSSPDSNEFVIKEKLLYSAGKNCFTSREAAKDHFEEAYKAALVKYANIMNGIEKLKESFGYFSYSYYMSGDTYGIESDGQYIEFKVNGYDFRFAQ